MRRRIMIAGGGTGGHLFPGIAVAEAARRRDPETAVVFVGSARGIEARVVPGTGFELVLLPAAPLRGRGVAAKLGALATMGAGTLAARRLEGRSAPDVVIGLGGYASAPAVVAGRLARVPIVLLEQNAMPGLTTRLLARLADRVCVSFPETAGRVPSGRAVVTGNPVRTFAPRADAAAAGGDAAGVPAAEGASAPAADVAGTAGAGPARRGPTIAIVGGSAGAHRLNQAGPALRAALADLPGLTIVHQTGLAEEASVRTAYAGAPNVEVRAFIDDMGALYASVDLIVCRAGATTIAELAAAGVPAIFVPYPHAADDHQRKNAEALVRGGAARIVLDHLATGARLAEEVRELLASPELLAEMRRRMRQFARPDAAARVLAVVDELAGGRL